MIDAPFAGRPEPVQIRATAHTSTRAKRNGLDDVAAAPDSPVTNHFHTIADGIDDGGNQREWRRRAVQLPSAVVREGDRLDARVRGDHRVFNRLDALDDERPRP